MHRTKDLGTQPGPRSEGTPVPAGEGSLGEGRAGHRWQTSRQRRDQKAGHTKQESFAAQGKRIAAEYINCGI